MCKEKRQVFSHGSITELFSFFVSSIFLMAYDKAENVKLLRSGCFSVNLVMKGACPIFATVCCVEDFQWPLTKDMIIIRVTKRTFAIALPGLLYGLQFPNVCQEFDINILQRVFMKFSHYKDINDNEIGYPLEDNEPNFWNRLRHHIEPVAHETLPLVRLGQLLGPSRFQVAKHNSCFLRATRMSATTKLITDCMVRSGTLTSRHISIRGTNPIEVFHQDLAFASVSVFTYIVDAVELAWIMFFGLNHLVKDIVKPHDDIGFKVWSLNEDGLMAFMHLLGPFPQVPIDNLEFNGRRKSQRQRSTNCKLIRDFEFELPKSFSGVQENNEN